MLRGAESHEVHPFCDVCGEELNEEEILKAEECKNYEFPICDSCCNESIERISYIISVSITDTE